MLVFAVLVATAAPTPRVFATPTLVRAHGPDLVRRFSGGGCTPGGRFYLGHGGTRDGFADGASGQSAPSHVRDVAPSAAGWLSVDAAGVWRDHLVDGGRRHLVDRADLWRIAATPTTLGALDADGRLWTFDLDGTPIGDAGPPLPDHALVVADVGYGPHLVRLPGTLAVAADLDGLPGDEVITADGEALTVFGWSDGWTATGTWRTRYPITGVAPADLDGVAPLDLAVLSGGRVHRVLADPEGWRADGHVVLPDYAKPWAVGTGDRDGDAWPELLIGADVAREHSREWGVFVVDGAPGGHRLSRTLPDLPRWRGGGPVDLDRDGVDELAVVTEDGLRLLGQGPSGLERLGDLPGRSVRHWRMVPAPAEPALVWAGRDGVWRIAIGDDGRPDGTPVHLRQAPADALAWRGDRPALWARTDGIWSSLRGDAHAVLAGNVRATDAGTALWWRAGQGRGGVDQYTLTLTSTSALPEVVADLGRRALRGRHVVADGDAVLWAVEQTVWRHEDGSSRRVARHPAIVDLAAGDGVVAVVHGGALTLHADDAIDVPLPGAARRVTATAAGFAVLGDHVHLVRPDGDGWSAVPVPDPPEGAVDIHFGDLDGRGPAVTVRAGSVLYALSDGWRPAHELPGPASVLLADLDGDGVHTPLTMDGGRRAVATPAGPWRHVGAGLPFVVRGPDSPDAIGVLAADGTVARLPGDQLDTAPEVLDGYPDWPAVWLDVDGDGVRDRIERSVVHLGEPRFLSMGEVPHPR